VSTSGGSPDDECYLVKVSDNRGGLMGAFPVSGNTGPLGRRSDFNMSGESAAFFSLEKVCLTTVRESVSYTVDLDMHD
jgi:hypothetical protein